LYLAKVFETSEQVCRDQNYFVYKFQAEGFYIFGGIIWARWQVFEDTPFFLFGGFTEEHILLMVRVLLLFMVFSIAVLAEFFTRPTSMTNLNT
jgi:hypothetical protein